MTYIPIIKKNKIHQESIFIFVTYPMIKKINYNENLKLSLYEMNFYFRHTARTGLHSSVQFVPDTPWQQAPPLSRPSLFTTSMWIKNVILPCNTYNYWHYKSCWTLLTNRCLMFKRKQSSEIKAIFYNSKSSRGIFLPRNFVMKQVVLLESLKAIWAIFFSILFCCKRLLLW